MLDLETDAPPPQLSAESVAETIDIGGAKVPQGGLNPLHSVETPKPEQKPSATSFETDESHVRVSYRQLLVVNPSSQRQSTVSNISMPPGETQGSPPPSTGTLTEEKEPKRTSTIKGTPLYMAPEILSGSAATRRSDIYSMGALLFELCTGAPPHVNTSLADLQRIATTQDAPPLTSVVSNVDARFAAIVDRCLSRDAAQRYASAEELRDALEQLIAVPSKDDIPEGNPYRGLLPFEAQHRSLFFGRKSEIGTLIDRLRTESFVLIAADSGVGKSSLCRAGVLPLIADGALGGSRAYAIASMVPGRKPLSALCAAVAAALSCDEAALQTDLEQRPDSFARTLRKLLSTGRGLFLFLDQMEELVTIGDPAQSAIVSEALASLTFQGGEVRLLATARSDFLSRLATLPSLGDDVTRALYLLRPMGPDKLREAVVGPALIKGVSFESDALVDSLVESTARTDGGLPLLQFALAELWEVRGGGVITTAALDSIGGVAGALARHGDHVVGSLPAEQRLSARRILMSLVTLERTRARRTDEELTRSDVAARPALDALVRGRLLVARDTAEGAAYEVAHEALIRGWDTLGRWLDEHAESRAVKQRLETSAHEWTRLGRSKDALWSPRQLAEAALLDPHDIGPREADFLAASEAAMLRSRRLRRAALIAVPVILGLLYGALQVVARRDVGRRVAALLAQGQTALKEAQGKNAHVEQLRQRAFALFDAKERDNAEELWKQMLALSAQADSSYARSSRMLEAALALDSSNAGVRWQLAGALYERALAAERENQTRQRDDLLQRMALYDSTGEKFRQWNAPGHISITSEPSQAAVTIEQYIQDDQQRWNPAQAQSFHPTPAEALSLPPGSYLLTLSAAGRQAVRYPFILDRGEQLRINVPLPEDGAVPKGLVYIPPGRFLLGSRSEESLRRIFLNTVPAHQVTTQGYFIAKNETTFADWIEFLRELPPQERKLRLPKAGSQGISGALELRELADGRFSLELKPRADVFAANSDEPMRYPARKQLASQNWLRFPVAGVSFDDAEAYAAWLAKTGRVPGARICTEAEWERAARGADNRLYPHADLIRATDANFEKTHDKAANCFGPDEIGSHPASRSPFGLDDMVGNHSEWTISSLAPDEYIWRGGGYAFDELTLFTTNRNAFDRVARFGDLGVRICATPPASLAGP